MLKSEHTKAPGVTKVGIEIRGLETEIMKLRPLPRQKKLRDEEVEDFRPARNKQARIKKNMNNREEGNSDIVPTYNSEELRRNTSLSQTIIRQVSPPPNTPSPKPVVRSTAPLSYYIKRAETALF